MALLTKKEFAAACGIETKQISVYASRFKIIVNGDYIDDSLDLNKAFIELKRARIRMPQYQNNNTGQKEPTGLLKIKESKEIDEFDLSYLAIDFVDRVLESYSIEKEKELKEFLKIQPEVKALPLSCIVAIWAGNIAEICETLLKREISLYGTGITQEQKENIKSFHIKNCIDRMAFCEKEINDLFEEVATS